MKERNVLKEKQAGHVPISLGNGDFQDGEGWKLVTSGTRRQVSSPADLQLQNRFSALAAAVCPAKHQSWLSLNHTGAPGVVGDYLLWWTKGPICQPDLLPREICSLQETLWKNYWCLFGPQTITLCCSFTQAPTTNGDLERIKNEYAALRMRVRAWGSKWFFSLISLKCCQQGGDPQHQWDHTYTTVSSSVISSRRQT